jgi:Holliday junction resolvasome RuvABC endonuclease subunit
LAANTVKKELTGDGRATKAKIRNTILALETFEVVANRHKALKQEEKLAGKRMIGLPQDVFDALGIAIVGAKKLQGENDRKKHDGS